MSNTWRNGFVDSFSLRRKHIFEGLTSYWWTLKGFVFNNLILNLLVFQKILVKPLEIQTNRCHKLQENLSCLALKANGLGNLKYCSSCCWLMLVRLWALLWNISGGSRPDHSVLGRFSAETSCTAHLLYFPMLLVHWSKHI